MTIYNVIYIENIKKSLSSLKKKYPDALIIDLTSKGEEPWIQLSPFFPHGDIPIPFSSGYFAYSVEGIWQGLKIFKKEKIDTAKFLIKNMVGIKRNVKKLGKPLGHSKGIYGEEILDYLTARHDIYLSSYTWVLDHKVQKTLQILKNEAGKRDVVLLDFTTNGDINNLKKPLSHAALVKSYLEKKYPELITKVFEKCIFLRFRTLSPAESGHSVLSYSDTWSC